MSVSAHASDAFRRRVDAVRDRVDIVAVVGRVVKLGKGGKPRGKCPFHGSKSDSLAVDPGTGRAKCWGCDWSGDAIAFVRDHFGLSFVEALERLETDHGLEGLSAAPIHRDKQERARPQRDTVESAEMGRFIWDGARADIEALRIYFRSRGVPEHMLSAERFADLRLHRTAPIVAWEVGRKPGSVPNSPAMVALVRHATDWRPIGAHVTYLRPDLAGKMERARQDGSAFPSRKMMGEMAGGCVVLPGARSGERGGLADRPLFVGEGLETVLCGMAMAEAGDDACGVAALSLSNLQGHPKLIRGALPLYDPEPDPARAPALAFPHGAPVTGLIDADMKPLRGPRDRRSGQWRGVAIIERRNGPIVERVLSTGERAELCGKLFVHAWRACGCAVRAIRPRMGLDFNDAVRERAG